MTDSVKRRFRTERHCAFLSSTVVQDSHLELEEHFAGAISGFVHIEQLQASVYSSLLAERLPATQGVQGLMSTHALTAW